ncbi:hypothetical protein TNCV_209141 [Trichonephila clavipes]|uniref:Uncharacterized protein n=1 Tax=Trichonephila clavipes TaxID=2585209 RepID=A0A8X6SUI9_TRICX|nr:hypothetical protein TNCV_209141 [Trichonephila clavipes]
MSCGLITSAGSGEYSPPIQFHDKIVKVEIGGVTIYSAFGEFRRAKSPVWCSRLRPMTGVLLAPCQDQFRGPRSDYVRQTLLCNGITVRSLSGSDPPKMSWRITDRSRST